MSLSFTAFEPTPFSPIAAAGCVGNNKSMYLLLAFIWLICGVGLLAYQVLSGDQRLSLHIGGAPISCGWIMILLSAWNLMRWWSRRPSRPRQPTAQLLSRRQRIRRIEEPTERDPNFIFTDEPPPTPPRPEGPPSPN